MIGLSSDFLYNSMTIFYIHFPEPNIKRLFILMITFLYISVVSF